MVQVEDFVDERARVDREPRCGCERRRGRGQPRGYRGDSRSGEHDPSADYKAGARLIVRVDVTRRCCGSMRGVDTQRLEAFEGGG